jgi:transcriptional regulator with XRE-family HTH domain
MNRTRDERFKDARLVHNQHGKQTLAEVAAAVQVTQSQISDLESDAKDRGVDYRTIGKLAQHYGVSVDWLLGLIEIPSPDKDVRITHNLTGLTDKAIATLVSLNGGEETVFTLADGSEYTEISEHNEGYCDILESEHFAELADLFSRVKETISELDKAIDEDLSSSRDERMNQLKVIAERIRDLRLLRYEITEVSRKMVDGAYSCEKYLEWARGRGDYP